MPKDLILAVLGEHHELLRRPASLLLWTPNA
jgi:hypothetical protein